MIEIKTMCYLDVPFVEQGPFAGLDAEAINEEVEVMWTTMVKLTKTFLDQVC